MNDYNVAILIALFICVGLNVGLIWYNRKLVGRLLFVSENLNDLATMVGAYREHLKALYSTEMYYGDETMKHLIAHTTSLNNLLEDYEDIIYLTDPIEDDFNQEEDDFEKNEENPQTGQDVFYGGARESNN